MENQRHRWGGFSRCVARRRVRALTACLVAAVLAVASGAAAAAQERTATPFGDFNHDTTQPVGIEADNFHVENASNKGVLRGNVRVKQGSMRLACDTLEIFYSGKDSANRAASSGSLLGGGGSAVDRLIARGKVRISDGQGRAATAKQADYDVAGAEILLSGEVVLLQGGGVLKGDKLRIDLTSGTARVIGDEGATSSRVRMTIDPTKKKN